MVALSNSEIRNTYEYILTINAIVDKDLKQIDGNRYHLDKFVPSQLKSVHTKKLNDALKFKDSLSRTLYDSSVVSLVTAFEKVVFAKYRTSYGVLKNVVKANTTTTLDYFHSRERFVNDKIDRLAGILYLIEGIIDSETMSKLNEIKDHRNYIVHGKRDSKAPEKEYDLDTIAKTLDTAITEIEKDGK